MAKLYIFHRNGRSEYQLADHNVLGRHPKNRIKVQEPGVSKVHCLISQDSGRDFTIRDLGSRNGTYVNGKRITGKVALKDGDDLLLGNTRCLFREEIATTVIHLVENADILSNIRHMISPLRLNKFFPEANIIDEEMLRSDYERLRILFQLSRDIGFDLHVDFILGRVLDRAHEVLDFDYGVVFLANESGTLNPQSYKMKQLEDRIAVPTDLLEYVKTEQKGVLVSDAPCTPGEGSGPLIDREICSMMAIPILFELDFLGIVFIEKKAIARSYGERELHLLSNVANKSAMFIRNSQIAKRVTRESLKRERFRQLVSPEVAEMVVSGQLDAQEKGDIRDATALVVNVRNFTGISEFADPVSIVAALNAYFEELVEPVLRLEGMVDGYMGDRLVALWGIPLTHDDDTVRAVRAALEMQQQIAAFNRKQAPGRIGPFQIGIGIDTGALVSGTMGAGSTARFSVIGEAVGSADALASSAESGQVVVSENVSYIIKRLFDLTPLPDLTHRGGSFARHAVIAERPSSRDMPWTHLG